jgi:hypothetical protein
MIAMKPSRLLVLGLGLLVLADVNLSALPMPHHFSGITVTPDHVDWKRMHERQSCRELFENSRHAYDRLVTRLHWWLRVIAKLSQGMNRSNVNRLPIGQVEAFL